MTNVTVRFLDEAADKELMFAVIIARYDGNWVFCRHRKRSTWEISGGHRELGERIIETAARELKEETGAEEFSLQPVCVYSVIGRNRISPDGEELFGMLYTAEIRSFTGKLHFEMAEISLRKELPQDWTYPDIQPSMIQEYERRKGVLQWD